MDPYARSDLFVTSFDMNMYEALLRRDRDLKIEPSLPTEWSNIDPTTWQFKLRQGVKFHDGTPPRHRPHWAKPIFSPYFLVYF
jgi:peptide/nickel transport system substrate-binding protein